MIIRWPGRARKKVLEDTGPEPAENWDAEAKVLQRIGEWLAMLETDEEKFRVLTYWIWRLRSHDAPEISKWADMLENTAEACTTDIGERIGLSGDADK